DQYIQLPAGTISALGNSATFEAWVNWNDGGFFWQRIFDFGAANDGNGVRLPPGMKGAISDAHLFLTPRGLPPGATTPALFASFIDVNLPVNEILTTGALTAGTMQHVAVVIDNNPTDGGTASMILYVNGARVLSTPLSNP